LSDILDGVSVLVTAETARMSLEEEVEQATAKAIGPVGSSAPAGGQRTPASAPSAMRPASPAPSPSHQAQPAPVQPASMQPASGTMAPAGNWGTRLADTPGSRDRSALGIVGSRSARAATSACLSTRLT